MDWGRRLARKRERLDGIDSQHVSDTLDTRGWQLIRQRLERTRDLKIRELVKPSDAVTTAQLRGLIEGLGIALRVPEILMAEGKKGARDNDVESASGV